MAVKKTAAKGSSTEAVAEKKKATKKAETAPKEPKAKRASTRSKVVEKVVEPVKEHRFNFKLKDFGKSKDDFTVEEKLQALFQLQLIDSEIDRIRIVRGELPMEVADLEDEIAGLQTRLQNLTEEVDGLTNLVSQKKQAIKDSKAAIKKYEAQQGNVKNNREYDSLNKEIEFQNLEIQLSEKRIKEYEFELQGQSTLLAEATTKLDERMGDLTAKKEELDTIIAETQKEEEQLLDFSNNALAQVEERLSAAYLRIRKNARNGLAVVTIQRDACGGCFNKIPPQRQLDIRQHKKIIVCEHCGRILIDPNIEL
ncbi:MAG: zinc ribbon domain-containing protein [Bacteroidota bacterium]